MFKFLEKVLGKSSQWYEMLMRSKREKSTITAAQVDLAVSLLEPLVVTAKTFSFESNGIKTAPVSNLKTWPLDKKGFALPFYGCIDTASYKVNIFVNEEKLLKDTSNFHLEIILNSAQTAQLEAPRADLLQNKNWSFKEVPSLPIWEEIIHRAVKTHKKLVALAPSNPWTLYKLAKAKICNDQNHRNFIDGYPQWKLNDQDFRNIKDALFLLQITLTAEERTYYSFLKNNEVLTVVQGM